jgi:iron complex outermembrane receptor protein
MKKTIISASLLAVTMLSAQETDTIKVSEIQSVSLQEPTTTEPKNQNPLQDSRLKTLKIPRYTTLFLKRSSVK